MSSKDVRYELRMDPETHQRLKGKALQVDVKLSDAFRYGAEQYLDDLIEAKDSDSVDAVLSDFRRAADRAERLFRGR